jgi:hypothetical protein
MMMTMLTGFNGLQMLNDNMRKKGIQDRHRHCSIFNSWRSLTRASVSRSEL